MAEILGNQLCMESLASDVQDVQWTVNDVMSRVGPLTLASWKFPDKKSFEVDVETLLEVYSFTPEEHEENQVAHIALYELLIDRLVLLIQGTAVYLGQVQQMCKSGAESTVPQSASVGLSVKHFWSQLTHTQTLMQQLQSKSQTSARKVAELEKEVKKYTSLYEDETNTNSDTQSLSNISDSNGLRRKSFRPISVDESNKSSQTVETAFVPCEACEVVQKKLRESGDMMIDVCQAQGLPSCLRKYKPQIAHVNWLTYNDVCRWMSEQNKDISRLCKHVEQLSAAINPLKAEVAAFEKETKQAESRMKQCETELKMEKEVTAAAKRQFERKLQDKEKEHEVTLADLHRQKEELLRKHTGLEMELSQRITQTTELLQQLQESETRSKQLEADLAEKTAIAEQHDSLERETSDLRQQLQDTKSQLEVANKTLAKEQGKNKSAALHSQQVQAKQESLSSRIMELTQENEGLREEVCGLEEEKQALEESLQDVRLAKEQLEKEHKAQEVIIRNLSEEKSKLEATIRETEEQIVQLERQVCEAKDRERMLIEYPDLNGPVNPNLQGTGDIVMDMKNQVSANKVRIQVLEEQNDGLQHSITKVLSMGYTANTTTKPKHQPQPIPLWQTSTADYQHQSPPSHQHQSPPSHQHQSPPSHPSPPYVEPATPVPQKPSTKSQTSASKTTKPASDPPATEYFTVSRPPSEHKDHRRPATASKRGGGGGGVGVGHVPVNATSISAYKQIKKTVGHTRSDSGAAKAMWRPPSGSTKPAPGAVEGERWDENEADRPIYVCDHCDKMYTKARDLDIHKSYCTG